MLAVCSSKPSLPQWIDTSETMSQNPNAPPLQLFLGYFVIVVKSVHATQELKCQASSKGPSALEFRIRNKTEKHGSPEGLVLYPESPAWKPRAGYQQGTGALAFIFPELSFLRRPTYGLSTVFHRQTSQGKLRLFISHSEFFFVCSLCCYRESITRRH